MPLTIDSFLQESEETLRFFKQVRDDREKLTASGPIAKDLSLEEICLSTSKWNALLDETPYLRVYKCITGSDLVVTLLVNPKFTNLKRTGAVRRVLSKYRAASALVEKIEKVGPAEKNGVSREFVPLPDDAAATTCPIENTLEYRQGQIVEPVDGVYNTDCEEVCTSGIHFFLTKTAAVAYLYPGKWPSTYFENDLELFMKNSDQHNGEWDDLQFYFKKSNLWIKASSSIVNKRRTLVKCRDFWMIGRPQGPTTTMQMFHLPRTEQPVLTDAFNNHLGWTIVPATITVNPTDPKEYTFLSPVAKLVGKVKDDNDREILTADPPIPEGMITSGKTLRDIFKEMHTKLEFGLRFSDTAPVTVKELKKVSRVLRTVQEIDEMEQKDQEKKAAEEEKKAAEEEKKAAEEKKAVAEEHEAEPQLNANASS
jgi:hypothetical protein